jgi:hypothetical protein
MPINEIIAVSAVLLVFIMTIILGFFWLRNTNKLDEY